MNSIENKVSVLLVTPQPPWTIPPWADLATGGKMALEQWRLHRHHHVFADFGNLGDGMSGSRLCTHLRKEAGPQELQVILMSGKLQPHLLAWAQQSGASGVIIRNLEAIAGKVGFSLAGATSTVAVPVSPMGAVEAPQSELEEVVALVEARLQTHGRMGPARSIVVADAIDEFTREHPGEQPTATDVARRVAKDIRNEADRAVFLQSFEEGFM